MQFIRLESIDHEKTFKNSIINIQYSIILASISSRPGQCGRVDGYILEGKELEFYVKKIKSKKSK